MCKEAKIMIELNKKYNTKELAEALNMSYGTIRNKREEYEKHLSRFYFYVKKETKKTIYYIFTEQKYDYVPYKDFQKIMKKKDLINEVDRILQKEPRNTGSCVARIIKDFSEKEINYTLNTLTIYAREVMNTFLKNNFYTRGDFQWCESLKYSYRILEENEIQCLKKCFYEDENTEEEEEKIQTQIDNKEISIEEGERKLGKYRRTSYLQSLQKFKDKYGFWPIKVPVYIKNAWAPKELAEAITYAALIKVEEFDF